MTDYGEKITQTVKDYVLGNYDNDAYFDMRSWYMENDAPGALEIKYHFMDLTGTSYVDTSTLTIALIRCALDFVDWEEIKEVLHEDYEFAKAG